MKRIVQLLHPSYSTEGTFRYRPTTEEILERRKTGASSIVEMYDEFKDINVSTLSAYKLLIKPSCLWQKYEV